MASGPRSRSATRTWRPTTSSAHCWCCGPRGTRGGRALRWLCCALIVTAIVLTGSNGGALVLMVTTVLGALFTLARRRGAVPAIITAAALALAVLAIAPHVHVQSHRGAGPGELAARSRTRSAARRRAAALAAPSCRRPSSCTSPAIPHRHRTGRDEDGFPGPSVRLRQDGPRRLQPRPWWSAGVLGGVALVFLLVIVAARCRRIAARPLRPELRRHLPAPGTAGRRRDRHVHLRDVLPGPAFPAPVGAARNRRRGGPVGPPGP